MFRFLRAYWQEKIFFASALAVQSTVVVEGGQEWFGRGSHSVPHAWSGTETAQNSAASWGREHMAVRIKADITRTA